MGLRYVVGGVLCAKMEVFLFEDMGAEIEVNPNDVKAFSQVGVATL